MRGYSIGIAMLTVFLAAAPSVAAPEDEIRIPIVKASSSSAPVGWEVKEWNGKAGYSVEDTEIGKTLHLKSDAASTALHREVSFDIQTHRFLNWKWKVTKLPAGGDVRNKATDDQAIQVYVMFSRWPGGVVNRRVLGYIWDTGAPEGGVFTSAKTSSTRYIVLRSGPTGLGQWFEEKRNVFEDYKKLFDEEPHIDATGISVMIDSDDTKSSAESYINGIYISRQ